jgi:AAA15 family ATPase/GTPase
LLTQRIVKLFNSKSTNPNNAQLIFATHDTNLLDAKIFRRDQIWFTEKDRYGATQLYSLTDFKKTKKPRNDEKLEKSYTAGKYGAIPFLGDFDDLFEQLTRESNE